MSKEAMKLALRVLKNTRECDAVSHAIKALEEALAKQEQGDCSSCEEGCCTLRAGCVSFSGASHEI